MTKENNNAANDHRNLKTFCAAISFLLLFIFLAAPISGAFDYSSRGFNNKQYHTENYTLFNSLYAGLFGSPVIYSKNIVNNLFQPPVLKDITGDGNAELFVSSGNDIIIYQNKTLQVMDDIIFNNDVNKYSVYSFEGSHYIVATITQGAYAVNVSIYNITGGNFISNFWVGLNPNYKYAMTEACDETTGRCAVLWAYPETIYVTAFNLTGTGYSDLEGIETRASANNIMCIPTLADITVSDINSDGINEYVFSYSEISAIGAAFFEVSAAVITINSTGNVNVLYDTVLETPDFNSGNTCPDYQYYYTSPLIGDFVAGSTIDMVIGISTTDKKFRLNVYRWLGSAFNYYDRHPAVFTADGIILSNPVLANVFEDTGLNDYCVMGYTENNATDLLCGSQMTSFLPETREAQTNNFTNIFVPQANTAQNIIHSMQAVSNVFDGQDISEFLTPFGIYQFANCGLLGYCDLNIIYPISYTNGIASYGKVTDKPYLNLFYTTATNLYMIDDKYTNSNAKIDSYSINPCIESVWKQNTTVEIGITAIDTENDDVRIRAVLYADSLSEQNSGWLGNYTAGTTITASFTANNKTTSGKIKLQAQDIKQTDNSTYDEIILSFAVSNDGVSFGDCQTIASGLVAAAAAEAEAVGNAGNVTNTNNALTAWADETAGTFGIPIIIVILLFLAFLDIVIFMMLVSHPVMALTACGIIDFVLVIIFSLIGWIPASLVITLIVLLVIAGVIYISFLFNKSLGSGGG